MPIGVGQKIGRWVVLEKAERRGTNTYWLCRCKCGTEQKVCAGNLVRGKHQSCGCLRSDTVRALFTTHGLTNSPEYGVWEGLKQRCLNPKRKKFAIYGARGITVCDRWLHSFVNFYADMGPRPSAKHSIERRNNDGPYSPENCYWGTPLDQTLNRRTTLLFVYQGRWQSLAAICHALGVPYSSGYYHFVTRGRPITATING